MDLASREEHLRARLSKARARYADLTREPEQPLFWDDAYTALVELPLSASIAAPIGSFTTELGATFFCKEIASFFEVSGTLNEDATSGSTLHVPEAARLQSIEFTWYARDTGSQAPWSNAPVPSGVIRGGNVTPLRFIKGHRRVRGGSRVELTINVTSIDLDPSFVGLESATGCRLFIVLRGVSVRDGVL